MNTFSDITPKVLLLIAEKRELAPLFKNNFKKISSRFYKGKMNHKEIGIFITGVGKQSIKKSVKNINNLNFKPDQIINVGNVGSLFFLRSGTIIKIGSVLGENGKKNILLESNTFQLVTVKKFQKKEKIKEQYPQADFVDMELYYLIKYLPQFKIQSYKIILDTLKYEPNTLLFKIFLSFKIHRNAKKISNFLTFLFYNAIGKLDRKKRSKISAKQIE